MSCGQLLEPVCLLRRSRSKYKVYDHKVLAASLRPVLPQGRSCAPCSVASTEYKAGKHITPHASSVPPTFVEYVLASPKSVSMSLRPRSASAALSRPWCFSLFYACLPRETLSTCGESHDERRGGILQLQGGHVDASRLRNITPTH